MSGTLAWAIGRSTRRAMAPALLAALLATLAQASEGESRQNLEVAHRARMLAPGELVELRVLTGPDVIGVTGKAFSRDLAFYAGDAPGHWIGLVGLDLDVKPGRHRIQIESTTAGGAGPHASYVLEIAPRTFPERRLSVREDFVNPPASVVARIEAEARRVQEILARVTGDRLWRGPFTRPVPGSPTSSFGRRNILNGQPRSPHSGTDFRAAAGTPVRAPNAGRVALADDQYFSGNTVIIDHGLGLFSFLAHLSRLDVRAGDSVTSGQVVGLSGATGRVTGPHLHWTVRLHGARVDPLSVLALLGAGPAAAPR